MTNEEFQNLVLSKADRGSFKPLVNYDPDGDTLEVLISNESHRIQNTDDRFIKVYCGRDSGDVTGVRISGIKRFITDIEKESPDIHLEVHNGRFKVAYLFRAIREKSKKGKMTLGVLIKRLEEFAEEHGLEANIGGCAASAT